MRVSKKIAAVGTALTVSAGSVVAAPEASAQWITWPAPATSPVTARQGFNFFTLGGGNSGSCTIAYNDAERRVSYTSAHCGNEGQTVYLPNAQNRLVPAGTIHPSRAYDDPTASNDWAQIRWEPNVTVGQNTFSGDRIVPLSELTKGEKICMRGNTSYGTTADGVSCGKYAGSIRSMFFFTDAGGDYGDSGGVVFAPGKGFVGIYSGFNGFSFPSGGERRLERAVTITDTKAVSGGEINSFARSHFKQPIAYYTINGIRIPIIPELSADASSRAKEISSDGSSKDNGGDGSSLSTGAIIGIVVALLVAAVPVVWSFFQS